MEAFDTHDLYKEFDKAGVPPEQSEIFIKALKANRVDNEAVNEKIKKKVEKIEKNIVTKEDIKFLATNEKMERGNAELKVFVLQNTIGILIAVAGMLVGILKFLK